MLLQRVREYVRQHSLLQPHSKVVAALSGGSDSVALTVLLRDLDAMGEVRLVGAVHLNHQLRPDAERDERFSASVAQSLGVPFVAAREDVAARARRDRKSLEAAARCARYEFFERARVDLGADIIALGHTRDDQAETYLLRLIRGAGPRGLSAIHPRNGSVVRPLLDCGRRELRELLASRCISYVDDESNRDVSIPRNRVRAELVPLLEDRFNPAVVEVLSHEAALTRELWEWLESAATAYEAVSPPPAGEPQRQELEIERLRTAPPALRRLVLWRAMNRAAGQRPVGFRHVDAALRLLDVGQGSVDAPGHRVQRLGSRLVLSNRGAGGDKEANLFAYPLSIPGEVRLPDAGCIVAAELEPGRRDAEPGSLSGRGPLARVSWDACQAPLSVRNRRPGDRFRPMGVGGRKKLQDYFVDRKVVRTTRDLVPLVVDARGRIVWVAGYGIDEEFRVTDSSQSVLLLRLRQA